MKEFNPKEITFAQFQEFMAVFLRENASAGQAWDVLTCQRGPDSPSERPDQSQKENSAAYEGRRKRKYDTVEVIRKASFNGVVGSSARSHKGTSVRLPPKSRWDHFDRHVARAAAVLGLEVVEESK